MVYYYHVFFRNTGARPLSRHSGIYGGLTPGEEYVGCRYMMRLGKLKKSAIILISKRMCLVYGLKGVCYIIVSV